jgi:hypothetical protein
LPTGSSGKQATDSFAFPSPPISKVPDICEKQCRMWEAWLEPLGTLMLALHQPFSSVYNTLQHERTTYIEEPLCRLSKG